jgi:hypothetical protein
MEDLTQNAVFLIILAVAVVFLPSLFAALRKPKKRPAPRRYTSFEEWAGQEDIPAQTREAPQQMPARKTTPRPARVPPAAAEGPGAGEGFMGAMAGLQSPGAPPKRKAPVFSDDPVVNGIVWAEILRRGGTRKR